MSKINEKHIEFIMTAIKLNSPYDTSSPIEYANVTDGYLDGYSPNSGAVFWSCYDVPDVTGAQSGWDTSELTVIKIYSSREVLQKKYPAKWGPFKIIKPVI